jgi:glycogen debranching enzyme
MTAPDDIILVRDRYYILATSALADDRTLVLKHGDTFAVFDRYGDLQPVGDGRQGLFHADTRFLRRLELRLARRRPLLLSSSITEDDSVLTADSTNPDLADAGDRGLPRDVVHVFRACFLRGTVCHLRLRVRSYAADELEVPLELRFDTDFADIFEVRGTRRARRGLLLPPEVGAATVRLGYRGLDERLRATELVFDPPPARLDAGAAEWRLRLRPGEPVTIDVTIRCVPGPDPPERPGELEPAAFDDARAELCREAGAAEAALATLATSNEQFNAWLSRSAADLRMMLTRTPAGPYPYAGVPWYSTPFGRDGILTALETLWVAPDVAAGVLRFLAAHQATAFDAEKDAEPGKILHEMRAGEMARTGEVPFDRYYGTVDATPLYVVLAGTYLRHTGDVALVRDLWPNIEAALTWIVEHGDRDGDGFVEYERRGPGGLTNQGWKDSHDSVFHADGTLARGPIALVEVQAYASAALVAGARIASALGMASRAEALRRRGAALRERLERAFWCEDLGTYALALDGEKRPCRVRTSNAGHVLATGAASRERAARVAKALLGEDAFSGWGVRTLSAVERRYNPMSYHNGSVWPHDNAIVVAGLARYGHTGEAVRIVSALFDAALFVHLHRLPELLCGFHRRAAEGPTLYPVACAPQAWAAGAVFMLLGACLGLSIDGHARRVTLHRPVLPPAFSRLRIGGLRAGDGEVDLELRARGGDVAVHVTRRLGAVEVLVSK